MPDFADLGNELAEKHLSDSLARHRRAVTTVGISATWCEDCGEVIPLRRREMVPGCLTCVDCQQLREVRRG